MADIRAAQSGDFSATTTWVGEVVPGSSDVAFSNTFTVTISDARTVQAISNAAGTGITVGGTFSLLNGCNLTCTNANGIVQGATTTSCITTPSLGLGSVAFVNTSAAHTTSVTSSIINFSSSGTLNTTGNYILTGTATTSQAITVSGTGTLNHAGNITGGNASSAAGLRVTGNCNCAITGVVSGGTSISAFAVGISIESVATVAVTGLVSGGNAAAGIVNNAAATLTVNGTCQSGNAAPAIGVGSVGQITRLSGPFLLGANGNINPVQAASWRWAPTQVQTFMEVAASNGTTKRNLFTADNMPSGGYPATSNVRSGTIYGPNSENTGTLAVPSPSSVALGVAVDNTIGSAVLTEASVRQALGMASANLDTQLASKPAAVAIRQELDANSTKLANLDVAVSTRSTYAGGDTPGTVTLLARITSGRAANLDGLYELVASRLASTNYASPPDAASIAAAVWTATARTLTTAIPSASSIATAVWGAVSSGLTEAGSVGKLIADRLDVAVGSRLAADDYEPPTTAPTAEDNAIAVRAELGPELERVSNCATVDTTGAQIQGAVSE
jgi:hypothetical protein